MKKSPWTKPEEKLIRKHFLKMNVKQLVYKHLPHRSRNSIYAKAKAMGMHKERVKTRFKNPAEKIRYLRTNPVFLIKEKMARRKYFRIKHGNTFAMQYEKASPEILADINNIAKQIKPKIFKFDDGSILYQLAEGVYTLEKAIFDQCKKK